MKNIFSRANKAQQIVEFAIVIPILMIVLFIVVEFGAALNARLTVGEGIKMTLAKVNQLSSLDGDVPTKVAYVQTFVRNELIRYLVQHNIPNSNSIEVTIRPTGETASMVVGYQYHPHFILPGLFGGTIGDTIAFSSSQNLNPHIFMDNVFPGAADVTHRTTADLGQFNTDMAGDPLESGAIVDGDIYKFTDAAGNYDVREKIGFLLHFYGGLGTHPNLEYDKVRLVSWGGFDVLPQNMRFDLKTGTIEVRSPYYNAGVWFDTRIPYIWVATAMGFTHLIYVKYNSLEMYVPDDSANLYKLHFSTFDHDDKPSTMETWTEVHSRNIRFCGQDLTSGDCYVDPMNPTAADQRGRGTVNERALRMNPRLGDVTNSPLTGNNDYIIGTMEPINIPSDPTHYYKFVNSHYHSYPDSTIGDIWLTWDSANWQNQYLITVSSPYIFGLDMGTNDMADAIYHPDLENSPDMHDSTKNPFYLPFQYRFKINEQNDPNAGVYAGPAPGGLDDGDIDANNAPPHIDPVEPAPYDNAQYTADIVDVYTDSDADGIPDAWDRDPTYFDANVNGIIDGNEIIDMNAEPRCNDGVGEPLNYMPDDPAVCDDFPEFLVLTGPTWDDHEWFTLGTGGFAEAIFYLRQTPYRGTHAAWTYAFDFPEEIQVQNEWTTYTNPSSGRKALYMSLPSPLYPDDTFTRRFMKNWWDDGLNGCESSPNHGFNLCHIHERRKEKTGLNGGPSFIHGTPTGAGPDDVELAPSDELQFFFNNDVFSPNTKIQRTLPAVW